MRDIPMCSIILTLSSLRPIRNGKTGEELHRRNPEIREGDRYYPMRTQRITLQSALLSHVRPNTIQLSKKLAQMTDQGAEGVELRFKDGTVVTADLVVGADGIRSVCSSSLFCLFTKYSLSPPCILHDSLLPTQLIRF